MDHAFLLDGYPEDEESFHALEWNFPDVWHPDLISFLRQRHYPEDFPRDFARHKEFRWVLKSPSCRWPDFRVGTNGWILVSLNFQKMLLRESESPEHYQFLEPVYTADSADSSPMGYKLLNICDHLSCLDLNSSQYTTREHYRNMHEYVLRQDAVDGVMHIFRIKEHNTAVCVSKQLGGVLMGSGLTGFSLQRVRLSLPTDAPV